MVVPRVLDEYSRDAVLVLEPIEHFQSCAAAVTHLSLTERRHLARVGLRALYRMIFDEGIVHADLHPGNVGWIPGTPPRLVMLDFGLVARLSSRDRAQFARFFLAMSSGNGAVCSSVVLATASAVPGDLQHARFRNEISEVVKRHAGMNASEFNVVAFVGELFEVQRAHRVVGSVAFMTTILALVAFEGTLRLLDPELDFQGEARHYLTTEGGRGLLGRALLGHSPLPSYARSANPRV